MSTARGRSMLIQRRPRASTISTRGSVRSGALSTTARVRRPNGLRGRLGMPETERLVGRRHQARNCICRGQVFRYAFRLHSWTHPEGWRDWPYETPPTWPGRTPGQGGNSIRLQDEWPGRCGAGFPGLPSLLRRTPGRRNNHMPADALKCKECSTTYPLEARYVCERCFGPLEVAYSRPDADPAELQAAGSRPDRTRSGATRTSSRWRAPRAARCPTGWTPLVKADRLAAELGPGGAVDQERDREPDALVQGPRRLGRRSRVHASSASTRWRVPARATSRTPSRRTPRPPGCPPTC